MALWVDKYRPHKLCDMVYCTDEATNLSHIIKKGDFAHMLIYGPNGSGKKTMIECILHELYGNGVEKMSLSMKSFQTASGKKLFIQTIGSNYHVQLSPGDVGIYDRVVVQEMIKQMAQTQQIDSTAQRQFKVVVLMEVEQLSRDAQHALRRTMEKYSSICRLILCSESITKIIEPLRSRCMVLRIAAPSNQQMENVLRNVCKAENINATDGIIESVIKTSNGNMRRALLMLEAAKSESYPFKENQLAPQPDWEIYLNETARMIVEQQNADNLLKIRSRLYECLGRCIPPDVIMIKLLRELLQYCDSVMKREVISQASFYEHQMCRGHKAIIHLEAFIAAFMHSFHQNLKIS